MLELDDKGMDFGESGGVRKEESAIGCEVDGTPLCTVEQKGGQRSLQRREGVEKESGRRRAGDERATGRETRGRREQRGCG